MRAHRPLMLEAHPGDGDRRGAGVARPTECRLLVPVREDDPGHGSWIRRIPIRLDSQEVPVAVELDGSEMTLSTPQADALKVAISRSIAAFSPPVIDF